MIVYPTILVPGLLTSVTPTFVLSIDFSFPLLRPLLLLTKSANLEVAARRAVWGTFTNAGQTCIRPDYMMVHASVADELVAEMKKASVR